jgi:hypothetical protein
VRIALVEEQVLEDVLGSRERRLDVAELVGLVAVDVAALAVVVDARLGPGEAIVSSGLYFTSMRSSASTAVCSSTAITAATGSPTKRTLSRASGCSSCDTGMMP